ncbi:AraC family transcriptional regulator [Microbacteriaceae bacterium VKM Ac-2854]|nr:AraC family transcriptional regulator [Microbacteriaceae bacterium VKM Ac-2854]
MTDGSLAPKRYSREYLGPEGAEAMRGTQAAITPMDPENFRARIVSMPLVTTRIVDLRVTPIRAQWAIGHGEDQGLPPAVFFALSIAGRSIGHHNGRILTLTPGTITLIQTGTEYHTVTASSSRTLTFWLAPDQLSSAAAAALRRVAAEPLQDDAGARGATAVVQSLLAAEPGPESAAEIERVLVDMVEAIILAADARRRDGEGVTQEVYAELRELIEADPAREDVRPEALAEALGVEKAQLLRAVRVHGLSVADAVRQVRLDAAAARLRDRSTPDDFGLLAAQTGFGGYTQLARAFRERTGMTMGEYRTLSRLQ